MRKLLAAGAGVVLLAGCGRMGPTPQPDLPKDLAALYQQVQGQPTAEAWVKVGDAEYRRRDWPKVAVAYQQALALDDKNAEALVGMAMLHVQSRNLAEANRIANLLDQAYRDDAKVQARLGTLYLAMGNGELALASWGRALDIDPNQPLALVQMAHATLTRRDLTQYRRYYNRLAARYPNDPLVQQFRFGLATLEGDKKAQEQLLRQAYNASPDAAHRDQLARWYLEQRRFDECIQVLFDWADRNPLPKRPPDDPAALKEWCDLRAQGYILPRLMLAGVYREKGDVTEARRMMRELINKIEQAEEHNEPPVEPLVEAQARIVYADSLMADRRKDVAIDQLLRARELAGSNTDLLLRVADSLAEFKADPCLTMEIYQDVIEDDASKRPQALEKATVFLQTLITTSDNPRKEMIEAVERQYIGLLQQGGDTNLTILNNLAWHLAQFSSDDKAKMSIARRCIARAIELFGRQANLLDTLGYVLLQGGDLRGAEANFRAALAELPDNPEVMYHMALLAQKQGNRVAARQWALRALARREDFPGKSAAVRLSRL